MHLNTSQAQGFAKYDLGLNAALIGLLSPVTFIALLLTAHFDAGHVPWLRVVLGTIMWWIAAVVLFLAARSAVMAGSMSKYSTALALTIAPVIGHSIGCVAAFRVAVPDAQYWVLIGLGTALVLIAIELGITTPWKETSDEDVQAIVDRFHL